MYKSHRIYCSALFAKITSSAAFEKDTVVVSIEAPYMALDGLLAQKSKLPKEFLEACSSLKSKLDEDICLNWIFLRLKGVLQIQFLFRGSRWLAINSKNE